MSNPVKSTIYIHACTCTQLIITPPVIVFSVHPFNLFMSLTCTPCSYFTAPHLECTGPDSLLGACRHHGTLLTQKVKRSMCCAHDTDSLLPPGGHCPDTQPLPHCRGGSKPWGPTHTSSQVPCSALSIITIVTYRTVNNSSFHIHRRPPAHTHPGHRVCWGFLPVGAGA